MFKATVDEEINLCLVHHGLASKYVELVEENREYLSQWLPWASHCKAEDDFKNFMQNALHNYAEQKTMTCAIEFKGKIVGNISFNTIDFDLKKVEIGYWLAADQQGQGIMTRSCQYLIDYAFTQLGMEKVQISAAKDNKPSRAVCERLGMKLEGIITNTEKVGDRVLDHAIYGFHQPVK